MQLLSQMNVTTINKKFSSNTLGDKTEVADCDHNISEGSDDLPPLQYT